LRLPAFGKLLHRGGGLHYSHGKKVVYRGQSINKIVMGA
jgi:hypothetical protein